MHMIQTLNGRKKVLNMWNTKKSYRPLGTTFWQWDMEQQGLLCKTCFDKKETDFNSKKAFCTHQKICGVKLGFFRYNPKSNWKVSGQLCRKCWDAFSQKG